MGNSRNGNKTLRGMEGWYTVETGTNDERWTCREISGRERSVTRFLVPEPYIVPASTTFPGPDFYRAPVVFPRTGTGETHSLGEKTGKHIRTPKNEVLLQRLPTTQGYCAFVALYAVAATKNY